MIARIIDLVSRRLPESALPAALDGVRRLPPNALRTAAVAAAIGAAGLVAVGALWLASQHTPDDSVFYPYFDMHLGPFQRIANGGIPYVQAQTQTDRATS